MSKRKATKGQQDGSGVKKPRAAGAAASAAATASASAASSSADSLDDALRRADLVPRIAVHTLKLADAIRPANESHSSRMKALIVLMKADADRPESLLDWSLVPPDDEVGAHQSSQRINNSWRFLSHSSAFLLHCVARMAQLLSHECRVCAAHSSSPVLSDVFALHFSADRCA